MRSSRVHVARPLTYACELSAICDGAGGEEGTRQTALPVDLEGVTEVALEIVRRELDDLEEREVTEDLDCGVRFMCTKSGFAANTACAASQSGGLTMSSSGMNTPIHFRVIGSQC